MKLLNLLLLFFFFQCATAQNVSINILTQNSGIVGNGQTVFLQVDIANTDGATSVPNYKLRPQISVPAAIVTIPTAGHSLPAGWAITFNSGSVIRLSNGTDQVPPNTTRTILIALQAIATGGPSTISSNLFFSNGVAPGSSSGPSLPGDVTADNTSTSTVQVTIVTPLHVTDFSANILNCNPVLNWVTETEVNSNRFEIERADRNLSAWVKAGTVLASGNSNTKNKYSFSDIGLPSSESKVFYRLKMIDRNGSFTYSTVLPVFLNCRTSSVHVFPNPVQNQYLFINISTTQDKKINAVLLSAKGEAVLRTVLFKGTNKLHVANLSNGVYTLKVDYGNGTSENIKVLIHSQK